MPEPSRRRTPAAKLYVVSNIFPHNAKVKTYLDDMAPVIAMRPDALIMADPGLIAMIRERWPEMPEPLGSRIRWNWAAVKFWQSMGSPASSSRANCRWKNREIRQQCPDMELEVFVHGALCIAYSGRCLLSGYFNHRDPNQGTCTNSCRWDYKVQPPAKEDAGGDVWLIEEKERPGELMPIEEDEHGTYIMNSKDLRAIEHVQKLVAMGIDSLKIEGRTKSPYYAARTCQSHRQAIDDDGGRETARPGLLAQLDGLANRGYTDGFYQRHHDAEYQNYLRGHWNRRAASTSVMSSAMTRRAARRNRRQEPLCGRRPAGAGPSGRQRRTCADAPGNADRTAIAIAPGQRPSRLGAAAGVGGRGFVARFV